MPFGAQGQGGLKPPLCLHCLILLQTLRKRVDHRTDCTTHRPYFWYQIDDVLNYISTVGAYPLLGAVITWLGLQTWEPQLALEPQCSLSIALAGWRGMIDSANGGDGNATSVGVISVFSYVRDEWLPGNGARRRDRYVCILTLNLLKMKCAPIPIATGRVHIHLSIC